VQDDDTVTDLLEGDRDIDVLLEEELIKTGKLGDKNAVVLKKLVKTYQKKNCCPGKGGVFRAVKGTYLTM
jgi:hypothetical protein